MSVSTSHTAGPSSPPEPQPGTSRNSLGLAARFRSLLLLILMFLVAASLSPSFLKPGNLAQILVQNSYVGILAVGETLVILTGGIDLSVGSMMLCSGVITAGLLHGGNVGTGMASLACVGVGTGLGLLNALLVTVLRLPPFIATLATMSGAISIGKLYSNGSPITIGANMPESFRAYQGFLFRSDSFPGVPVSGLVFLGVALAVHIILTRTRYGRYIYALGGNREATRLSGLNVRLIEGSVYVLCGMLCGIAALLYTARLESGQALSGMSYELDAIAAAVIGGASLSGGIGTIGGAVVGLFFVGILTNLMALRNVNAFLQEGIRALAIVVGVLIQSRKKG